SVRIVPASESLNFGTNTVTFVPQTAGNLIDLGGSDIAGTLGLSDAELDKITAGTIIIGDVNGGAVTVSANISRPASTIMDIASGANIDIAGGSVNTGGGNLNLLPGTNV